MSRLPASLDAPPSGRGRPVWFDAVAYGRVRLLGGQEVPWRSPAELSSFFGKLAGMFRSDAILADVGDLLAQHAAASQPLRTAMAARTRTGYALRTLLGDEQARAIAAEAVRVLAATGGPVPLVLTMPAPGRWMVAAARQALGGGVDLGPADAGQAETAAIYIADFLRLFGDVPVDGVLLDEGGVPAGELIDPQAYRPVLNVADHYGWSALILTGTAAAWPFGPVVGVTAWLGSGAPKAPDGSAGPPGRWGAVADPEFWAGADPPDGADLLFAAVPAEADPDAVMKRVRALT